ncbi:Chromosome (plasmid) partitioning protein ParB [hydrothermal vent metagenome]|uniref:Chromosome (Plasmid) partitioning protein ParB n=1 Tax=hydrothermal vent metagenome TaxID=652676 RepID=A0A3B0VFX0_9ZZZZ
MATHRLGRGLNALLPASDNDDLNADWGGGGGTNEGRGPYFLCPLDFIIPNPYQPRTNFKEVELAGLSASIKEKGVLQPLIVRRLADNKYELIAGERRWRAARLAELEKVPVLIKDISISDRLELALIENIQREGLNPLEEAKAYGQLVEEFGLTQEVVARRVGKSRSTITNSLRILQLPEYARQSLANGDISAGHGRVLLSLENEADILALHDRIIKESLSVRETEKLGREIKNNGAKLHQPAARFKKPGAIPSHHCQRFTQSLKNFLGAKSKIVQKGNTGRIEIEYSSPEELERLLGLIVKQ